MKIFTIPHSKLHQNTDIHDLIQTPSPTLPGLKTNLLSSEHVHGVIQLPDIGVSALWIKAEKSLFCILEADFPSYRFGLIVTEDEFFYWVRSLLIESIGVL